MYKFLTKTLLLLLGFLVFYFVFYILFDLYYNSKDAANSLFIWGDSQTYQGIDLDVLKNQTNKKIYSAARHGAGIYDFLVFAEKVPKNSDVLVAISKPAQLRRKKRDRNRSGISVQPLKALLNNNYSWDEVFHILKKNTKPRKLFLSKTSMYEYADSIKLEQPIEHFEKVYKTVPSYLKEKQNLYLEGIKNLMNKNCSIYLIDFPYHELLSEIENNSPIKNQTDTFFEKIRIAANCTKLDTLVLKASKEAMHDLTHLNSYGAKEVSLFIGEKIKKQPPTTFCIINGK